MAEALLCLDAAASAEALRRVPWAPQLPDGVYAPCNGTALLITALTADRDALRALRPTLCAEIGCGTGVVAAHMATILSDAYIVASDIHAAAPLTALKTAAMNNVTLHPLRADLLACFRPGSIDCVVFHVPYVPTSQDILDRAVSTTDSSVNWAGGPRGRGVLLRLLPMLRTTLSTKGIIYLLFFEVEEIVQLLAQHGVHATPFAKFRSPAEVLYVLRCTMIQPNTTDHRLTATNLRPRVLVLDCGSVTNKDATADLSALAAAMGLADAEDCARRGMAQAWSEARASKQMDASRYWRLALTEAGSPLSPDDPRSISVCEQCVAEVLRFTFDDTIATVKQLKEHGIWIGIISNHIVSPPWFQVCAEAARLYELASDPSLVVVSQEVEVAKPDRRIYEIFFSRVQRLSPEVSPRDLLFVDDKSKNVAAAQALGWKGLCFNASKAEPGALAKALSNLGLDAI